jgi:NtrC-family two-component system response regulator AlgB
MKTNHEYPNLNILIIDDEQNIRKTLTVCLESSGHNVISVSNHSDAVIESNNRVFDIAFVDLRLGTGNGLDLIPVLIENCPWIKIIVITAYASIDTAVEAMRRGASDYLPKPFTPGQVEIAIQRAARLRCVEQQLTELKDEFHRNHPEINFVSSHPGMMKNIETARLVAKSEATIMLRGPSGTGKTSFARAIHEWSSRASKPLGFISCPSLSPELLESRSEERRVGKECRRLCRSRWSPYH